MFATRIKLTPPNNRFNETVDTDLPYESLFKTDGLWDDCTELVYQRTDGILDGLVYPLEYVEWNRDTKTINVFYYHEDLVKLKDFRKKMEVSQTMADMITALQSKNWQIVIETVPIEVLPDSVEMVQVEEEMVRESRRSEL